MSKPVAQWTEDDVVSLPLGENDTFERKGTSLLDLKADAKEDEVLNELAKQLSAFANTGGGQIIYGVDNKGAVDSGGVSRAVKGRQSTNVLELKAINLEVRSCPPDLKGPFGINLHIRIENTGRLMARNGCFYASLSPATALFRHYDSQVIRIRAHRLSAAFWEIADPVYPGMEIDFWVEADITTERLPPRSESSYGGPWDFGGLRTDVALLWRLFADNAPVKEGRTSLEQLRFTEAVKKRLAELGQRNVLRQFGWYP